MALTIWVTTPTEAVYAHRMVRVGIPDGTDEVIAGR